MAFDFGMVANVRPTRTVEFFRSGEKNVKGEWGRAKQKGPPSAANGDFVFDPSLPDGFYKQQIDIAVAGRLAIGVRTEEDDLLRMKLLDQNVQIGKELIGDLMHGMMRVSNHVLANLMANDGWLAHCFS